MTLNNTPYTLNIIAIKHIFYGLLKMLFHYLIAFEKITVLDRENPTQDGC
ncbi:hypothetical protein [Syntrophomonas zehnderi]|nr:hypothetical protein [Syntrophomonas zehnderi]